MISKKKRKKKKGMGLIVVVSGMALWGFGGGGEGPTVGGYYSLDIHLVSLCTNTFSRAQVAGWSRRGAADVERNPKAKTEFPVITTDPHLLSSTSWAGEVQFLTSRRAPRRSAQPQTFSRAARRNAAELQSVLQKGRRRFSQMPAWTSAGTETAADCSAAFNQLFSRRTRDASQVQYIPVIQIAATRPQS